MERLFSLYVISVFTVGLARAQPQQVVIEANPQTIDQAHIRCMILPAIFPTNISSESISFDHWYDKVDVQYGALRATISTADIVIAPLTASLSSPPYKGPPLFEASASWFTSITSLGMTHASLANTTTLRSSQHQLSKRDSLLNVESVESLGSYHYEGSTLGRVTVEEVRGFRIGVCSFIYPLGGSSHVPSFDPAIYSRLIQENRDSIDFWIAIPYWRDGQYGHIQGEEQQNLMRSILDVGFNLVVGYASKHLSMVSVYQEVNHFAMFDVGSALPESVSQTCSGAILEVSIDPKDGSFYDIGLVPTYPLLVENEFGELELSAIFGRDLEEGQFLEGLTADQKDMVTSYMATFRKNKPSFIQEFYYPQTALIRDNASNAVQLERGWIDNQTPPKEADDYAVQFLQMSREITLDTNYYTYLKGYSVLKSNGRYHYLLGKSLTLKEAEALLVQLQLKSHDFSKIVRLKGASIIPHTFTN